MHTLNSCNLIFCIVAFRIYNEKLQYKFWNPEFIDKIGGAFVYIGIFLPPIEGTSSTWSVNHHKGYHDKKPLYLSYN